MRSTYSPDDNKLRLYSEERLAPATYERVKAAGFRWAPKQKLFVAPMWTPEREDLLISLCGEIEDEDMSLVERAEIKAERLQNLAENRADQAHSVKEALGEVSSVVGHQSARRAEKLAEKLQGKVDKAVKLWEESKYWKSRADGALRTAKYKEVPAVRHRRIKGLESDIKRLVAAYTPRDGDHIMQSPNAGDPPEPYAWCGNAGRGGAWERVSDLPRIQERNSRWIRHYEMRLVYERAMLAESGGIAADQFKLQIGGQILCQGKWATITRINRKADQIVSVSTNNTHWPSVVAVEDIREYQEPTEELIERVKAKTKLLPMCNYPGEAATGRMRTDAGKPQKIIEITKQEWEKKHKDYKGSRNVAATDKHGAHRIRFGQFNFSVGQFGDNYAPVFIKDIKRVDPPAPDKDAVKVPDLPPVTLDLATLEREAANQAAFREECKPDEFDALKGIKVEAVSADQLFPTPPELARRLVKYADIKDGNWVLEPSAGTGALLTAILGLERVYGDSDNKTISAILNRKRLQLQAVEINFKLAEKLRREYPIDVRCSDFLELTVDEIGMYDIIIMNPPFTNGSDIKHINHARGFLKQGGRLVAICAAGPRQRQEFEEQATEWLDLPPGSFASSGTNVNTAIVIFDN